MGTHTYRKTQAKVKVRNLITHKVLRMRELAKGKQVNFVTLSGDDIKHERSISGGVHSGPSGVQTLTINKDKEITKKIQQLLKLDLVANTRAVTGDIFDLIKAVSSIRTFAWFDFCDLAKSWEKFFDCVKETNFCNDSQMAVTFCAAPRAYMRGKFMDKHFPFLKDELKKCEDKPQAIADRVFGDCCRKMKSLGWNCNEAVSYTVLGGKMLTFIFDRKKYSGGCVLKDITPAKRKKHKKQADMDKVIEVWEYAQKLGLSATELSGAFRNKQAIAHITMAAKKKLVTP